MLFKIEMIINERMYSSRNKYRRTVLYFLWYLLINQL